MSNILVKNLVECGCISFFDKEPFSYASGLEGPIYCDNRKMLGFPKQRNLFVDSLKSLIETKKITVDLVIGVATGGVPIAAILADRLNIPFCYVRATEKKHGRSQGIEGNFSSGMKAILIEDLINQGGSVHAASQKVISAGLNLQAIFSLVNYSFDLSISLLREFDCPVYSLVTFDDLKQYVMEDSNLSKILFGHLVNWHKDPTNWKL